MRDPTAADAARIGSHLLSEPVEAARFQSGAQHFVFEVRRAGEAPIVLRLSRARDRHLAKAALAWSARLRPMGLPLPRVLAADTDAEPHPWMALERLPGCDLGDIFEALPAARRRELAFELAALNRCLDALPDGSGYGFTLSENGPFPHLRWIDVLEAELARSQRRIEAAGAVSLHWVEAVRSDVSRLVGALSHVPPRPFLHDITTKNVIIDGRRLSGIVDVDSLCYGDVLYLPGLITAILRAYDYDLNYAEDWLDALGADAAGRRRTALYARIHAVGLLSEIGHSFNRDTEVSVGGPMQNRLEAFLDTAPN
ncbi:MAG: phosphotransferase [Pseudomonadota bacterium]